MKMKEAILYVLIWNNLQDEVSIIILIVVVVVAVIFHKRV